MIKLNSSLDKIITKRSYCDVFNHIILLAMPTLPLFEYVFSGNQKRYY